MMISRRNGRLTVDMIMSIGAIIFVGFCVLLVVVFLVGSYCDLASQAKKFEEVFGVESELIVDPLIRERYGVAIQEVIDVKLTRLADLYDYHKKTARIKERVGEDDINVNINEYIRLSEATRKTHTGNLQQRNEKIRRALQNFEEARSCAKFFGFLVKDVDEYNHL